ncbi:MAG: zinc metallopeptidase [Myxococcales bacterium]|nr:zinc metallopeptidase [Myxococcales bacterium]
MRMENQPRSSNVEDRRGRGGRAVRMGAPIGCGTLILAVAAILLGADPAAVLALLAQEGASPRVVETQAPAGDGQPDAMSDFLSAVLADTERTWHQIFADNGSRYVEPKLVLFTDQVASACGYQSSAVGPFYCPGDSKVYVDLSFYETLSRRFGAAGDFAQAYVLAHEVGHHVQNLLGTSAQVSQAQRRMQQEQANKLSVLLELQADCYAGVWGHHAHTQRQLLEDGDVEEGLRAAAAIGDDALQKKTRGFVVPESFTHGTSEQRVSWFVRGLKSGKLEDCDTFSGLR